MLSLSHSDPINNKSKPYVAISDVEAKQPARDSKEKTHRSVFTSNTFKKLAVTFGGVGTGTAIAFACSLTLPEAAACALTALIVAHLAYFLLNKLRSSSAISSIPTTTSASPSPVITSPKSRALSLSDPIKEKSHEGNTERKEPENPTHDQKPGSPLVEREKEKEKEKEKVENEQPNTHTPDQKPDSSLVKEEREKEKEKVEKEQPQNPTHDQKPDSPPVKREKEKEEAATDPAVFNPSTEEFPLFTPHKPGKGEKPEELPSFEIPERTSFIEMRQAHIPQMTQKYSQWFKEAANKSQESIDQERVEKNYEAIVFRCTVYGQSLLRWAKEWDIPLKPQDKIYQDLLDQFIQYFYEQAVPHDAEKLRKTLEKDPEDFAAQHLAVMDFFFISSEHKALVKMLVLKFQAHKQSEGNQGPVTKLQATIFGKMTDIMSLVPKKTKGAEDAGEEGVKALLCDIARLYNEQQLEELNDKVKEALGVNKDIAARVLDKLIRSEYRLGLSLVDEPYKEYLLNKAIELKDEFEKVDYDLDNLLFAQKCPTSGHVLFSRLPAVETETSQGSGIRNQYNMTVNRAFLQAQLKNQLGYFKDKNIEDKILEALGFPTVTETNEREAVEVIHALMKAMLDNNEHSKTTLANLRDLLDKLAFEARMSTIGITGQKCDEFRAVVRVFKQIRSDNENILFKNAGNLIPNKEKELREALEKKFPRAFKELQKTYEGLLKNEAELTALYFIKKQKELIQNGSNLDLEAYEKALIEEKKKFNFRLQKRVSDIRKILESQTDFYKHFLGPEVNVIPYAQGQEGEGTTLGSGICRAKTFDVDRRLIKNPLAEISRLDIDTSTSMHRYMHATYKIQFKQGRENYFLFPDQFLEQHGLDEELLDGNINTIEEVLEKLRPYYESLQDRNPAVSLSFTIGVPEDDSKLPETEEEKEKDEKLPAHIISIRFDKKNNRFILYDSNHLIAELKGTQESPPTWEEGIKWLEESVKLLMKTYISRLGRFYIKHLITAPKVPIRRKARTLNSGKGKEKKQTYTL